MAGVRARRRPIALGAALLLVSLVSADIAAWSIHGAAPGATPGSSPGATGTGAAPGGPSTSIASPAAASPAASGMDLPAPAGVAPALPTCPAETQQFPAGYTAYHTYTELCEAIVAAARAHPAISRLFSIGTSDKGRQIWAMEISTHLTDGTHPPGVLFDGLTHGLEHLSLEMPLAIMGWLLNGYGSSTTITNLVRTRAIFIVFDVNPDGAAYDIAGGVFHQWRKNRQPNANGSIGTDINRNYADHWGCCGLVSSNPSSGYYKGTAPFSTPEAAAVEHFVQSLVFGGRQEIRASISFHASGRLVMWPYGYTTAAIPSDMTAVDHSIFVALGRHMASLNGYRPEQASSLYIDSGTARDWYYGKNGIYAFTFELGTGTYQPSSAIAPELSRNRAAVLYLIEMAGCPYQATKGATHC